MSTQAAFLSDALHKRLSWHEYANEGELLASGTLGDFDPMLLVERRRGTWKTPESRIYARCAASEGLRPIGEWAEEKLCWKCPDRESIVCDSVGRGSEMTMRRNMALTDVDAVPYSRSQVCVPAGCPHATAKASYGQEGYFARVVEMLEKTYTPHPISWKITKIGSKVDLCIQYRRMFVSLGNSGQRHKESSDTLYCHITADIERGATYISDIHSMKVHLPTNIENNQSQMETLTYTGDSDFLASMYDKEQLFSAINRFSDFVKSELRARFGEISEGEVLEDPIWRTRFSTGSVATSPNDALASAALANRFPYLGFYPLTLRKLAPLYLRRRFDHLPREIRRDEIADALGLPRTDILDVLYASCDRAFEVVALLSEYGIDDVSILEQLALPCKKPEEDQQGFTDDMFSEFNKAKGLGDDAIGVTAAYSLLHRYMPGQMFTGPSSDKFAPADMASLAVPIMVAKALAGRETYATSHVEIPYYEDDIEHMIRRSDIDIEEVERNSLATSMPDHFKRVNRMWEPRIASATFNLVGSLASECEVTISPKNPDADILAIKCGVRASIYLDRRRWTKKNATKFFHVMHKIEQIGSLDLLGEDAKGDYQEMCNILARAIRFSFSLASVGVDKNRWDVISSDMRKDLTKVIYGWAGKSNVEVPIALERSAVFSIDGRSYGQKIRRELERQNARAKKAKKTKKATKDKRAAKGEKAGAKNKKVRKQINASEKTNETRK